MKKKLIYLLIAFSISGYSQNGFYYGTWSTTNANKTTIINSSSTTNLIYRISNGTISMDNVIEEYQIIVDGQTLAKTFLEAGGVIVEGKKIEIRQIGNSNISFGVWEVIQRNSIDYISSTWAASPTLNKEILVAELKIAQEFNFVVNSQSTNCSQEFIEIFVDGISIKDSNNRVVQFPARSCVIGKGKRVTIKVTGSCANNSFISGKLLLKKP